jgi:hypothetical protein
MSAPSGTTPRDQAAVPPLREGDHLDADEFLRRYEAMPEINKAQLVEGVVFMPSPVSTTDHGGPHFNIIGWLGYYCIFTPGVEGSDNATVQLDPENVPQPDVFLRIRPEFGGRTRTTGRKGYIAGAPELMVEVSGREGAAELTGKRAAYRRNGVREFIVWRVPDAAIDWFILRRGRFQRLRPSAAGIYKSEVFPGLWLDAAALVQRNLARVLQVLQQGLASPEHVAFVEKLRQAGAGT